MDRFINKLNTWFYYFLSSKVIGKSNLNFQLKFPRVVAVGIFVFVMLGKPVVDFFFFGALELNSLFFTILFSPLLAAGFILFEPNEHWARSLAFFY
jgi:hypothetical protein